MVDIEVLNSVGDFVVALSLFYVAYGSRGNKKLLAYYFIMGLAFLVTAIAFLFEVGITDFSLITMSRTVLFTILLVESLKYAMKGFERIRLFYLLYAAISLFAFSDIPIRASRAVVIIVSYLIIATACIFLLSFKKPKYGREFLISGLLGSIYPIFFISYDQSIIFSPQTAIVLPSKILLAVFFTGLGYNISKNPYRIYDRELIKFGKAKSK